MMSMRCVRMWMVVDVLAALWTTNVYGLPVLTHELSEVSSVSAPAEVSLGKGYEALSARKLDDAKRYFEEAAKLDPKSVLPWLGLADVAMAGGNKAAIEAALKKAAEIGPDRVEPVIALARYRYASKAYDQAESLFQRAVKMAPKSATPLVDLGDLYLNVRRDASKALPYYEKAVEVAPEHGGAHYAIGTILLGKGDAVAAISHFEKSSTLEAAKNPLPLVGLGDSYLLLKKATDAVHAYTRALDIQPNVLTALLGRAAAYVQLGQSAKALDDLNKAAQIDPRNPDVPFRMGALQEANRDFVGAYASYERSVKIDPNFVPALNNLSWLAASRRERLDDALVWIRHARSLAPKSANLCDTHGWVLRSKGDLSAALAVFNEGIAIKPSSELYYHLGVVQMESGAKPEARKSLKKALQMRSDFTDAEDAKRRLNVLDSK